MMKRLVLAVLLLLLILAGCGFSKQDCARPEVLCIGLVTNTAGVEDHGLNQSTWEGLQRIQRTEVIESVDARDYSKNIAAFAGAGYDLIVTSGAGLREETMEAAQAYEAILFLGLDQEPADPPIPNFVAVTFPQDQGGFLAGALAAQMTRTSVIGAACETSGIPSNWRACEGFRAGARHINPDVTVMVEYRGGSSPEDLFLDEEWGWQAAQGMIAQGADVIFGVGGRIGQGALRAAAEAGAWGIGSERDQFYVTREARARLLLSVVPDASDVIYRLIASVGSGIPAHEMMGQMELTPYHDSEPFVPGSIQTGLAELKLALRNGRVATNVAPEQP
jgi:basic membrane protein A